MKKIIFQSVLLCLPLLLIAQTPGDLTTNRIRSVIDSSHAKNVVLKQSFVVKVPLDSVWNAYTTKKGLESWAAAMAEIDLKIDGIIKTNYNKDGKIGDDSTITLHIINYVPKGMLTLQAEITENFPEFMKEDEEQCFNVILFEELSPNRTKVIAYGLGYENNEKYMSMMKFFVEGNEQSYRNLISYLETGKPSVKY